MQRELPLLRARRLLLLVALIGGLHDSLAGSQTVLETRPGAASASLGNQYDSVKELIRSGRPNAAICRLQSALALRTDHNQNTTELRVLLANAYRAARKDERAAQTLEGLLVDTPKVAELHFELAEVERALGALEVSLKEYREGLRLEPANRRGMLGVGQVLLQTGKAPEAVPTLKRYIRLWPADEEGCVAYARALSDTEQWPEARRMFLRAVYLNPNDYSARYFFATMLYKTGDAEGAAQQFQFAETLKPDEVQVHSSLARALSELGKVELARKETAAASNLMAHQRNVERASFCIGSGNSLMQRGELREAEAQFREALGVDPQNARARSNLGLVLALLHKPEASRREIQQAIKLDPKLAPAFNALGIGYLQEGHLGEAKAAFEQAVRLQPEYAEAKNNLGALYAKSGDGVRAVDLFKQSAEDAPDYPQSYLNWGLVLATEGELTRARKMFEKALKLSPDLAQARRALELIDSGEKAPN